MTCLDRDPDIAAGTAPQAPLAAGLTRLAATLAVARDYRAALSNIGEERAASCTVWVLLAALEQVLAILKETSEARVQASEQKPGTARP